ncbi:MAG TPA: M12 family metallopeptidase [Allocoleopsis sp.]
MKLFILFSLILLLCFQSFVCRKPDSDFSEMRTCGVPFTKINRYQLDTSLELVFNPPYKWKKNELDVFFTDVYDYELIQKTLGLANEWAKYSNIKFKLSTDRWTSDIRVSFREERGYLSAIGNTAKDPYYTGKATLWLHNLDNKTEEEFRRVVLHEFGHAIGLEHELQSPASTIQWDTLQVYRYYDSVYKWEKEKVDSNIFQPIQTGAFTKFDPKSIMIYAVPAILTKNKIAIPWPENLSSIDKSTIKKYYPF